MNKVKIATGLLLLAGLVGLPGQSGAVAIEDGDGASGHVWPSDVPTVLSDEDVTRYRELFAQAQAGQMPNWKMIKQLDSNLLVPHVQAVFYQSNERAVGYDVLKDWLTDHRDLPEARNLYQMAEVRRPAAPTKCEKVTKTVQVKVGRGKHAKMRTKKVTQQECRIVGERPPLPPVPLATEQQEAKRQAQEAARQDEYAGMPIERATRRRQLLTTEWQQRVRGNNEAAFTTLMSSDAKLVIGEARWQDELLHIADTYDGKRNYPDLKRVAAAAATANGPGRDTALWLAGMASYRMGQPKEAETFWGAVAQDETPQGKDYARACWWGARAARELGDTSTAQTLLQKGAQDGVSFYGQLSAAQLGGQPNIDFSPPAIDDGMVRQLTQVPGIRRALALAQVGETGLAQDEIKLAYSDVPPQAGRSLAGLGIRLQMPATALAVGKDLQQKGEVIPGALYPIPNMWHPRGRELVDRALMLAIMRQESAFQPTVGSRVGAQGLMQLMPETAKYIARLTGRNLPDREDLHDPTTNLTLAQDYLNYLNQKLNGNLILLVASYNGGVGNVQKWLVKGTAPSDDPLLFIESIPFDETKDYVEKVLANLWLYQQRLGMPVPSRSSLSKGSWPIKFQDRDDSTRRAS